MKYLIKFRLGKSIFERAIDPRYYIEDLKELGNVEVNVIKENIPSPEEEPTEDHCFWADIYIETDKDLKDIQELLEFIIEDGVEIEVIEGGGENVEEEREEESSKEEIPETLLENYKLETEEILSRLRETLEELYENPGSSSLINEVFRSFHTLKGNTGLILSYKEFKSLKYIHEITHSAESVLQQVRDKGLSLSREQIDILNELVDRIDDLFLAFSEGKEDVEEEDIFELLDSLRAGGDASGKPTAEDEFSPDISALYKVVSQYVPVFRELCSKEDITEEEADFFRRSLTALYKLTKELNFDDINSKVKDLQNSFGNIDFREFCQHLEELNIELYKLIEQSKPKEAEDKKTKTADIDTSKYVAKSNYLKVQEKTVQDLMDIVGELSVFKEWMSLFALKIQRTYGTTDFVKEFKDNVYRFRSLMDSLQKTVLEMRMVPLSVLFERFPKLVRDLSRMLGKKIKIKIEGADTKLDKTIVERIAEPLIHIIRNSIDHGIESVEERQAVGKSPEGTIVIRAFQEGGNVIIEVADDGRGIDVEKVKKKAIEKGLYTEEELNNMSEEEIMQIIFQPGFSTKEKATELSGRGVGMDVVMNTITNLGGEVSVKSERYVGTTVRLSLPLTLAIRKMLLVNVGGLSFGVPAENVGEVIKVNKERIKTIKGKPVIYHRDKVLSLDFINERLGLESKSNGVVTVLVDNYISRGVVVDEVISTIDTVVKPIPDIISTTDIISGVTILGDGSIVYVLEVMK